MEMFVTTLKIKYMYSVYINTCASQCTIIDEQTCTVHVCTCISAAMFSLLVLILYSLILHSELDTSPLLDQEVQEMESSPKYS